MVRGNNYSKGIFMKLNSERLIFNNVNRPQEIQMHYSLYKKLAKTQKMIEEGENPDKFEYKGGVNLKVYEYLDKKFNEQKLNEKKIHNQESSLKDFSKSEDYEFKQITKKNALVLLTEFKDKKHTVEPEYFREFLFAKSKSSMRDYFLEASYQKLDLDGDISKWYTTENERIEYVDNELVNGHYPKARELVKEAISELKKDDSYTDFSKYAKDGKIEILIVIYAGKGLDSKIRDNDPEIEKYIWPHYDELGESIELKDGIEVDKYCIISELPKEDLGVFCHEVAHTLGLPDLYYNPQGPIIGSWCLMSAGSHNNDSRTPALPCAWCKIFMGWAKPEIITGKPKKYEIPAVIDSNKIYKLEVECSDGKEYFLVENRQKKGFDKFLPYSGLLIWHIDESVYKKYLPNSNPQHFFLTLEQSDGKEELEDNWIKIEKKLLGLEKSETYKIAVKNIIGDSGDVFPGEMNNKTFNDKSKPNSDSYLGKRSGVIVESISDSEEVMTAVMGINPLIKKEREIEYKEGYKIGYGNGYRQAIDFLRNI